MCLKTEEILYLKDRICSLEEALYKTRWHILQVKIKVLNKVKVFTPHVSVLIHQLSSCVILDLTGQHQQEVKELEEVKESLSRQLKTLQEILDNQLEKYKEQVSHFLGRIEKYMYKEKVSLYWQDREIQRIGKSLWG